MGQKMTGLIISEKRIFKLQAWAFAASFLTPIEIIDILMLTIGVCVAVLPEAFRNKLRNTTHLTKLFNHVLTVA